MDEVASELNAAIMNYGLPRMKEPIPDTNQRLYPPEATITDSDRGVHF